MADVCYIRCPECDEKFKSTTDKEGTKVRCPECDEPFRVTAKMISKPKGAREEGIKAAAAAPAPPEAPPPAAAPPPSAPSLDGEEEEGNNPYTMVEVKVAPRCPSCAKELLSEKDIICVHCGYNTLTREVGETKRTIEVTLQDQLVHLAPALGSLAFALFALFALLFYSLALPARVAGTWMEFTDSEPMRLFATVAACGLIFYAGQFGLQKVLFDPVPKEAEKE